MLLDTCTFLWIASRPENISNDATKAIDGANQPLHLSDVSVWEISLKWSTGKIRLPQTPRLWIEEQTVIWNLTRLPIQRNHIYRATELPKHHKDPFDRLLVAQAIEHNLIVLTPDEHIHRYPVSVLW